MPTIQERPRMFAPSNRQPTYASPQAIRIQQAKHQQQPAQVPPIRSMTASPLERRRPSVSASVPIQRRSEYQTDTPQQDVLLQEGQGPGVVPNPRKHQSTRDSSWSRHMAPIPAWVNEINAPQPRYFQSSLLQYETCPATDAEAGRISRTSSAASIPQHRTTPTLTPVPTRSDTYHGASAILAAQLIRYGHLSNTQDERPALPFRVVNNSNSIPSFSSKSYKLTLLLPASPPLSEYMFEGITGDADAMLDSVTGNSPWNLETFASVEDYLAADDGVEEKVEEKREEEDEEDFGWIGSAIRAS